MTADPETTVSAAADTDADAEQDDKAFLDQLRREIDEEVRRRRAAGDFPPSFERRLDELFARFTPTGVHDDHFTDALKLADRAAYFDVQVPIGSRRQPRGFVKWVLWQSQAWFTGYVVRQLNHFSAAVMRVVHLLDERLTEVERDVDLLVTRPLPDEDTTGTGADPTVFAEALVARLGAASVAGRVLHAECGDGALVATLEKAGFDAYGIDPGTPASDRAAAAGIDVRRDDPLGHLGAVGDGKLAALVLSGCVDRMTVSERRRLLRLAELKVAPGGTVCIVGTAPERWLSTVGPVVADLAPERPWHAPTWAHLLGQLGFAAAEVHDGPATDPLRRVDAPEGADSTTTGIVDALNEALGRLDPILSGPVSFAVISTRHR